MGTLHEDQYTFLSHRAQFHVVPVSVSLPLVPSSTISSTANSSRSSADGHISKSRSSPNDINYDIFTSHRHELLSSAMCGQGVQ